MAVGKQVPNMSGDYYSHKAFHKLEHLFLGKGYPVRPDYYEDEEKIILFADSTFNTVIYNGQPTSRIHSKTTRTVQIAPVRNKPTYVTVTISRFFNPVKGESPKTFTEDLPFVERYKRRSTDLDSAITVLSVFLSFSKAAKELRGIGIRVSWCTIRRTLMRFSFVDDTSLTEIGVDEVSFRRETGTNRFLTAVYNAKTGECVALLPGRDGKSFEVWLEKHPNVKIVCRDRASGYAKAIRRVLPACIQVADRFHLFQNLNEYIKKALRKELPETIYISLATLSIIDEAPEYVYSLIIPNIARISGYNFDTSLPLDDNGDPIEFDRTRTDKHTKEYARRLERAAAKKALILQVKAFASTHTEKGSMKKLCKQFDITPPTALKYIRMSPEEVEKAGLPVVIGSKNKEWDPYINVIYKMHAAKIDPEDIFFYVRDLPGFNLKLSALADYVDVIGRNNFIGRRSFCLRSVYRAQLPDGYSAISRESIITYATTVNPGTEKNQDVDGCIASIVENYPIVQEAMDIAKEFHGIIMGEISTPIEDFLVQHENGMISSLCKGIWEDLDAVRNAIIFSYNSGFVEGSNNLFKLIKRISFGKLDIENLELKFKLATTAEPLTAAVVREMIFG